MTTFKFWHAAASIVAICALSTACSTDEEPAAGEASATTSQSTTSEEPEGCLAWSVPCSRAPSTSPSPDVWTAASAVSYKSASIKLPGKGWLAVPADKDTPILPSGSLDSDSSRSAARVYDDSDPDQRKSKVTVSVEVAEYDPHALGSDLSADDMRTETTKTDLENRKIFGVATQESSINQAGVVFDVIASGQKSSWKADKGKITSWNREYNGVAMRKGGKLADGIKVIIECRAEFFTEQKCASLARTVFSTLRVKKK